jgi:hypothetical protein
VLFPHNCSKQADPVCDTVDGYVDYDATCSSGGKPEITVKNGNLQVQADSVTFSASGHVVLETGDPSCAEGGSVTADGLACSIAAQTVELADLSQKMDDEFNIKLPALKAELTETVEQSEKATSDKIDKSLKTQADSVERDIAAMKANLEEVVETDIAKIQTEVTAVNEKVTAIDFDFDADYVSEQPLFVLDYKALGSGAAGFEDLEKAKINEKNLKLEVNEGALNIKSEGPETPIYWTTNPFPGGKTSHTDQFQMVINTRVVGDKLLVDDSKSGQISFGFGEKQAVRCSVAPLLSLSLPPSPSPSLSFLCTLYCCRLLGRWIRLTHHAPALMCRHGPAIQTKHASHPIALFYGVTNTVKDKKVGEVVTKQRKILFSTSVGSSKDGSEVLICIEAGSGASTTTGACVTGTKIFKFKNSAKVKSIVLKFFPKSDDHPKTLVQVEAFLGLDGKGTSVGKTDSTIMNGVSFVADDMFIRQGLLAAEYDVRFCTTRVCSMMLNIRSDTCLKQAHMRSNIFGSI